MDARAAGVRALELAVTPLGWALRGRRPDESLSLSNRPDWASAAPLRVWSQTFDAGAEIPARCCSVGIGDNVSPDLHWSGVPGGTQALLFVLEDVDVPGSTPRIHTAALIDPHVQGFHEAAGGQPPVGVRFVRAAHGNRGYHGPRPLPGHGTHRYRFHLAALDQRPAVDDTTAVDKVLAASTGHVLAAGFLEGTRTA